MRSFVKIKFSRKDKITLLFTDMRKSCPNHNFFYIANMSFNANIKFSQKFPNLQYTLFTNFFLIFRCPTYPLLQPSCTLVPDTNDVCCKTPKCNPDPVTHKIPVPIPVFPAAISSHGSVQPSSHIDIGGGYTRTVYLTHQGFTPAPPTASGNFTGGIGK